LLAAGWLPFDPVLSTCDALVHHGGGGSALTALALGVPQVVVSAHADHAFNAAALARRGAGLGAVPDAPGDPTVADAVDHVVRDPGPRAAARAVAAEIAALPGPEVVVPALLRELPPGADPHPERGVA